MRLIDPSDKFYKPLATRIIIVVFCYGWALFEWSANSPFWAIAIGIMGTAALWEFFLNSKNDFSKDKSED